MKLVKQVVTYLIAGSLGVGKTSLIKQLLAQQSAGDKWAVLVNEFGQIGLDKALLTTAENSISITEIAGGCVCCMGGAPFQVALKEVLKKVQPQLLLIELSGLGHPLPLLRQLSSPPWEAVLDLRPMIYLMNASDLLAEQTNLKLAKEIGLLVVNKAELITNNQQQTINKLLAPIPIYWTTQGYLPLSLLPTVRINKKLISLSQEPIVAEGQEQTTQLLMNGIEYAIHDQAEGWAIGWQFSTDHCFAKQRLLTWLLAWPWVRAKLIVQTEQGWLAVNALQQVDITWTVSEWRKDSRIELIFTTSQAVDLLITDLIGCLINPS